jgi:hypothetical protein
MKAKLILGAFLLSGSLLVAQTGDKTVKVRVKKVENINGVEKTTDTVYFVNGPYRVDGFETGDKKDCTQKKMVIVTDGVNGVPENEMTEVEMEDVMDAQVESALREAGIDGSKTGAGRVIVLNDEKKEGEGQTVRKVIIIKKALVTEPSDADKKMLRETTGSLNGKLKSDEIHFYPNPNSGKFNLDFSLAERADTEVKILNADGKIIYAETLKDFTGKYNKEIDISKNPRGIYFVRIAQGDNAQLK